MAVVTGDRYLDSLVRFVDRNADQLLDGSITLRLNPAGLHYVQSRLDSLKELDSLLSSAPVDYFRAYVSDLGDHRALEQLRRILGLLGSLKVVSVLPPPGRDPTPLSLIGFGRLRVLELRGCDLSTSAARGLLELSGTIEKLVCHNSTDALRHVFASRIADIKDSPAWTRLSFVSCASNGLVLMDESLQLLPVVETLDLSRNRLEKVDNLRRSSKLKHLDLGFNHLRTISSLSKVSTTIVKLVLRNNALSKLHGLENLKSLQGLDLSYNIISSFLELEILVGLPHLERIWLEGNPICCARWYRSIVFSFFIHPYKLKLDEKGISTREYWQRRIIIASRQRQPAGYGFYVPAEGSVADGNTSNRKKTKNSRLAFIEGDEHCRSFCSDALNEDSFSFDSDSAKKDASGISNCESEIMDLINRVKFMKKEGPISWLREFKEWMDHPSLYNDAGLKEAAFVTDSSKVKLKKQRKGQNDHGESSTYLQDADQNSSKSNISDRDESFSNNERDIPIDDGDVPYIHKKLKAVASLANDARAVMRDNFRKRKDFHPSDIKGSSHHNSSAVKECDNERTLLSAPLTAIEEIMLSSSSSIDSRSPPQYREDILHRRLNLEEEFLQLAESQSVIESDSETSSSDGGSCREEDSLSESQESVGHSSYMGDSFHEVGQQDEQNDTTMILNGTCCSNSSEVPETSQGKDLSIQNRISFTMTHKSKDADSCHIGDHTIQNIDGVVKNKGKRKIRRVISLSETFGECEPNSREPNRNLKFNTSEDFKGKSVLMKIL